MALVFLNKSTYKPFMWAFKALMNLGTIQGNVGEWEDTISEVEIHFQIRFTNLIRYRSFFKSHIFNLKKRHNPHQ